MKLLFAAVHESLVGTKLPIRDARWTVAFEGKAEVAPISHFGSVCRVGPGNFTPSLSQIRT